MADESRTTTFNEYSSSALKTKGADVFRLNGAYLYRLAAAIGPLRAIAKEETKGDVYSKVSSAMREIDSLLGQEIIRLPATRAPALDLRAVLESTEKMLMANFADDDTAWNQQIDPLTAYQLRQQAILFEPVLLAELQIADIYVITTKKGFNTTLLAENGAVIFPDGLTAKVPEAENDVRQAARCLAFELPTAAAFHMHRANEAVVHAYYAAVAPTKKLPNMRAVEHWLKALEDEPGADKKVISALRDLQLLHRNPVVHPEDSLETIDEAIGLLGAVNAAIMHMLKVM